MTPLAGLFWLCAAAAPAGPLDELVRELELKHCDEAFALLPQARAAEPSGSAMATGLSIARESRSCKDPAVALAFTGLALKLAPDDSRVQLAHVENLLALKERGEAARILDALLAKDPDDVRARLARGRLAFEERDYPVVLRVLGPLAADPAHRDEVQSLLDQSRAALKAHQDGAQDLARAEAEARDKAKAVEPALRQASGPSPDSGKVVSSIKGKVSLGDDHLFVAKGTKKGESYLFRAMGHCSRKQARGKRRSGVIEDPNRSMFGVDFAVQFGKQDPRPLSAGQGEPERNEIPFVADTDGVTIRVFDRSSVEKGVSCTFSDFAVVVP